MKKFMDIVDILLERLIRIDRLAVGFKPADQLVLIENPSPRVLHAFLTQCTKKAARGLLVGQNMYWWDSMCGYHQEVENYFDPESKAANYTDRAIDMHYNDLRQTGVINFRSLAQRDDMIKNFQIRRMIDSGMFTDPFSYD